MFQAIYRFYGSTKTQDFDRKEEAIGEMERSTLDGRCSAMCVFHKETREIVWISDIYSYEKIKPYIPSDLKIS